jgi:hypothetical protein
MLFPHTYSHETIYPYGDSQNDNYLQESYYYGGPPHAQSILLMVNVK